MNPNAVKEPLIEVEGLKVSFHVSEGVVHALEDVSFTIARGQTLAVVGESGCGKSVTSQAIMQMVPSPGRIDGFCAITVSTERSMEPRCTGM